MLQPPVARFLAFQTPQERKQGRSLLAEEKEAEALHAYVRTDSIHISFQSPTGKSNRDLTQQFIPCVAAAGCV